VEERTRQAPDWVLAGAVGALLVVGILMVYSSSFVVAHNEFHDDTYFLVRQLIWAGLGLAGMLAATLVDYRRLRRLSLVAMLGCIGALVLVLVPGFGIANYGAARWLNLGPLPSVQPSEFAKLAVVLYMADWLSAKGRDVRALTHGALPFTIIVGLIAGLILAEPDLGTALVVIVTASAVYWVAGANVLHCLVGALLSIAGVYYAISNVSFRQDRLKAFLDPWEHWQDSGWHTVQTLIALGSGGIAGLGLGNSRQKFYYLPNAHTDAIFAIIGEELGLMGTLFVLMLFCVIGWRGLRIAFCAPDTYGRLLATGATAMIVWQAMLNIAVVTNTVPYTGITLPFVSFGGSSLVASLAAAGLLLSVSRAVEPVPLRWRAIFAGAERAPRRQPAAFLPRRRPTPWARRARPTEPALRRRPLARARAR